MPKKLRDHFVQRLLIRQFANESGRVFCFDKKLRRIPEWSHGNQPKDILFKRGYYSDARGDLDEALYKPVEQAFTPHLLALIDDPTTAVQRPGVTSALEEWIAAQATRTPQVEVLVRAYQQMLLRVGRDERAVLSREWINNARVHFFHRELDEMRSCGWRVYSADADEKHSFILADEPVIKTPPNWATGTMYLVPLSPRVLIAGGSDTGHRALSDPERNILPLGINGLAVSFAHRFVYSASLLELESVASMFDRTTPDPEHQAWMNQAQEPNFALEAVLRDATDDEVGKLLGRR